MPHRHNECWFIPKIKVAKQPCYSILSKICYFKVYLSLLKDAWWDYYIAQNKMIKDEGGYMLHEHLCFVNWPPKCTKKWWFAYQLRWCNYQIHGLVHCFLQTPNVVHQHDGNASFSSPCWQEPTLRTWTFCDLEWFWAVICKCWICNTWRQLKLEWIFVKKEREREKKRLMFKCKGIYIHTIARNTSIFFFLSCF